MSAQQCDINKLHILFTCKLYLSILYLFQINLRAVWGQVVVGGGCQNLNEQLSTLGMEGMTSTTFTQIEEEIGNYWKKACITQIILSYLFIKFYRQLYEMATT